MIRIIVSSVFFQVAQLLLKSYIQPIRDDGPKSHLTKRVPTMGGIAILLAVLFQLWFVGMLFHPFSQLLIGFGLLGMYDDVKKVYFSCSRGLGAKWKFSTQCLLSLLVLHQIPLDPALTLGSYSLNLGALYPVFAMLVVVSSSNAFNLTDGLDGLAASQAILLFMFFGAAALALNQGDVAKLSEVMVITLVGFLTVNSHPAKVFMGDVGSLPIGAILGFLAVVLKVELLFAVIACVMVWETASVIIQVALFKMGRGRFFKMAPFHHHLELSGWHEVHIVWLFAVVTLFMVLIVGRNCV
ncbi:MAG: phospho-N-acetylmuramoyl-pentapeptide-transferase [Pseudomonadota bacterium]|nr:phospho-N-acetylmuramoyl-pentapeptide-transferase [Pseudomonadota bacterium]